MIFGVQRVHWLEVERITNSLPTTNGQLAVSVSNGIFQFKLKTPDVFGPHAQDVALLSIPKYIFHRWTIYFQIPLMPPPLRFDKLLGPAVRCSSESQSEISSVDSEWNDKGTIAAQLGISNPDDMANERFKVDRQKLENLIKGNKYHFFGTILVIFFLREIHFCVPFFHHK